jgi:isovaleryl-CoA dehydrogenase
MAEDLTHEQEDFVRAIRDFCAREITDARLRELTDDFEDMHSDEVAKQMAELGWYGLTIDEEYGGSGGTFLDAALFLEETSRGARRSAATRSP